MLQYRNYDMPETKEDLFRIIGETKAPFDIIAGGTDHYAKEKDAFSDVNHAIDISKIAEFSTIKTEGDSITIGANTTIQTFLNLPILIESVPLFRHAAIYFADQQIREMATLGGNLANASPVGDTIPPLMVMDAVVNTMKRVDDTLVETQTPIAAFIKGVGKTALESGEIITSVTCPVLKGYGCAFKKVGLRRSLCISTVNAAFMVKISDDGRSFDDVRIAFGAVGPVPVRLTELEQKLIGQPVTKMIIENSVADMPDDIVRSRSRKEYRRHVVKNFMLAGLYEALAELGIKLQ